MIGGGVVGLSATAALLRRGADVRCYEAGEPMGERSAGDTRIFRLAHTFPDMVELAGRSRALFADWSGRSGTPLIDEVGTVVSGPEVANWAAAMATAGAAHEMVEPGSPLLRLPAATFAGPALIDPAGGVIRVDRIRAFLVAAVADRLRAAHVDAVEEIASGVRIHAGRDVDVFDAALICAGAGTPALAAGVGIEAPAALEHHLRVSFPIRPGAPEPLQCWITGDTYQHLAAPGTWAVGADVDPALVSWAGGRPAAERASREVLIAYATEHLPFVEPRPVAEVYCTHDPALGDGLQFARNGRVLATYGENLMKFAPLLGDLLAQSCLDGSTPADAGPNAARGAS
ncbi:sarcosine oxidase [Paractinoplanes atraurantiacus]|uniref:Sarcosine oxidase n=1 Tax=Paractinoplanes atraurantiacus TaxID=1036182 RepID=A0A285K7X0_9ACTN|nr:sarcosine oxidase [Actinoplanes atraurantiacus]